MPPQGPHISSMSILFIDGSTNQRTYWVDQLKRCSADYEIIEAADGQSGLHFYRSRRVDCVVMDLSLPDQSGFDLLSALVPIPRKPPVAILVLTLMGHRTLWEIAKSYGVYACFHKKHTRGEDLDRAIRDAVTFVRQMPKEDGGRHPM